MKQFKNIRKNRILKFNEDTSATGGPAVSGSGMGSIVSAQPSGLAGTTIGQNWASNGGTIGSGDVSMPYNPGGANRVFHKDNLGVGRKHNHGSLGSSNKRRKNKFKSLLKNKDVKDVGIKKNGFKKVLNFNDFLKNDFNTIKK